MKKIFITVIILLVLAGGALLMLPKLLPYANLQKLVQDKVRAATGREIAFSDARVTFLPDIALVLDDVTFSNASWAKDKDMLELKQLDLSLALKPLLERRIEVKRFVLKSPVIHLEKNADGKGNWDFAQSDKKPAAASGARGAAASGQKFQFRIGEVKISDGSLTYADKQKSETEALDGINVALDFPDLDSPLKLTGSVKYKQKPVTLEVHVEKPQAVLDGKTSPASVDLKSDALNAKLSGAVATQDTLLKGDIDADIPSLAKLSAWLGIAVQKVPFEKISFKSAADISAAQLKLTGAALSLDDVQAKGDVNVGLSGKPNIYARLSLNKLVLDRFTSSPASGKKGEAAPAAASAPSQEWDATPIDFGGLRAVDADMVLKTEGFSLKSAEVGPSTLTVTLKNGDLHFSSSEATLYGGKFSSNLGVNASSSAPDMSFKFTMAGVQAQPVLTEFAHFKKLSGATDGEVSLTSSGDSQKTLIGNLAGTGSLTFKNGALEGIDLMKIAKLIQSHLADMSVGDGKTEFVEMGGTFTIQKGVAVNKDLKMQGPLLQATGEGQVDLPQKYVQYRVMPTLTASSSAEKASGLSVPVNIKGPFSNIKVVPDYQSVIQNVIKSPEQLKNTVNQVRPLLKDIKKNPLKALQGILGGAAPAPQQNNPAPAAAPAPQPASP